MTDTVTGAPPAAQPSALSPSDEIARWLELFDAALTRGDVQAATQLFTADCHWRDLIGFTWNLKTVEGHQGVQDLLTATLANTQPSGWATEGQASQANGVTEGWFTFETAVARGRGYARIKNGLCWTLLTTLYELKGFEEKKGRDRIKGAEHGVHMTPELVATLKALHADGVPEGELAAIAARLTVRAGLRVVGGGQ